MSTNSIVAQATVTNKRTPLLERFLFETKLGEWLLCQLERRGLAIVKADWLAEQRG